MAAVVERHAHDRVAGFEQRHVGGVVGLGAGMGLDVCVLGSEQRLGAVDRELLGDVDLLAAAVVTAAGVALGVLVGQHRAGRVEHRLRDEVLRGDHLQRVLLAGELAVEHLGDLGVDVGERGVLEILRKVVHLGSDDSADSRPDHGMLEPAPDLICRERPWRRMRSSPPVSIARDVDHRRCRAGQLAAVDREVDGGYQLGGDRGERGGRRIARPVGRGLKQRRMMRR